LTRRKPPPLTDAVAVERNRRELRPDPQTPLHCTTGAGARTCPDG
jgi:hypothetical protein